MKVCVAMVCAMASMVLARPEPPVNQYLPSADNYATTNQDSYAPPPAAPSSTYGAPSSTYGTPSSTYGARASTYGAPASTYGAPSSTYGAPASTYGAPSSTYSSPSSIYSAPASAYGAPSSKYYDAPDAMYSVPDSTYGAPASSYGAPAYASKSSSSFSMGPSKASSSGTYSAPAVTKTGAIFSSEDLAYSYDAPDNHSTPSTLYGVPGYDKYSPAEDELSEPANYQFSYEVQDAQSGAEFGHLESRQGDAALGSYYVVLPDGRKQIVEYEADQGGFRPMIRYEEPQAGYGRGAGGPY